MGTWVISWSINCPKDINKAVFIPDGLLESVVVNLVDTTLADGRLLPFLALLGVIVPSEYALGNILCTGEFAWPNFGLLKLLHEPSKYLESGETNMDFRRLTTFSAVILDHFPGYFLSGQQSENLSCGNLKFVKVTRWYVWEKDNICYFDHPCYIVLTLAPIFPWFAFSASSWIWSKSVCLPWKFLKLRQQYL